MAHLAGPTWRRLKSCLEYKYRDIEVPSTGPQDRLKQLGLLLGIQEGNEAVLQDESLQLELGREAGANASESDLAARIHELAKAAPLERYINA